MKSKTNKTLPGSRKAKLPSFISPQLGTLVKEPPSGDDWLHELKFDGSSGTYFHGDKTPKSRADISYTSIRVKVETDVTKYVTISR